MKYCAFLRGININGINLKMANVCAAFSKAGMNNVSSVLATGNIIFESEQTAAELKSLLEKTLSEVFGYEAFLFLKSGMEIENIVKNCPFEPKENFHTYIFVTENGFEKILNEEFSKVNKTEGEIAAVSTETFYWQVPKGNTLDSEFGKVLGKKSFKSHLTSRNINTFEKILLRLRSAT